MQPAAFGSGQGGSLGPSPGQAELVHLNVGGTHTFTTTRATLCSQGGKLAAMFGGELQHTLLRDTQGRFFLDRDGSCFNCLLNYLRDGHTVLPTDRHSLYQLRAEAEHFNLAGLADTVDAALRQLDEQAAATAAGGGTAAAAGAPPGHMLARDLEVLDADIKQVCGSEELFALQDQSPPDFAAHQFRLLELRLRVAEAKRYAK